MTVKTGFLLLNHLDTTKGFNVDTANKKVSLNLGDGFKFQDGKLAVDGDNFPRGLSGLTLEGNTLKATLQDGTEKTVNLASLTPTVDLHVTSATIEGTQLVLKTSETDTNPTRVDLAQLAEVKSENSDNVIIRGKGSTGEKLRAEVKLDASANLLTSSATGLKVKKPSVKLTDAFGEVLGFIYPESEGQE